MGKREGQVPYMEVYMESLSKKTTILFTYEEHQRLTSLASRRGVSLGSLVREACMVQYGVVDRVGRAAAVSSLVSLSLPVGSTTKMKQESVLAPDALMP